MQQEQWKPKMQSLDYTKHQRDSHTTKEKGSSGKTM